jgi:PKD repeat protein
VSHTYVSPGQYSVSVTATDSDGRSARTTLVVSIRDEDVVNPS